MHNLGTYKSRPIKFFFDDPLLDYTRYVCELDSDDGYSTLHLAQIHITYCISRGFYFDETFIPPHRLVRAEIGEEEENLRHI